MDLLSIQRNITNLIEAINPNVYDELPVKDENGKELDFENNQYITYQLQDISDLNYKHEISLEVQVVSNKFNKLDVQALSIELDKALNKTIFKDCNCRIVHQGVWFIPLYIDDKFYVTLQYYVVNYKNRRELYEKYSF